MAKKIGIVGSGLSGTLAAIYLFKYSNSQVDIFLFEEKPSRLNKGIAYSQTIPYQPLNVPASGMSLYAENPDHFYNWVKHTPYGAINEIDKKSFLPRYIFGNYLKEEFTRVTDTYNKHKIYCITESVTDITIHESTCQIKSGSKTYICDHVLLAMGNFPPSDIPLKNSSFYKTDNYISNPWSSDIFSRENKSQHFLFVGSGLTMVDLALGLSEAGQTGKMYILSRRGFLPQEHFFPPSASTIDFSDIDFAKISLGGLLHYLRNKAKKLKEQGIDWRELLDALREHTSVIWKNLSKTDRQQFMRHLRPYWEIHRHRLPQVSYKRLKQLIQHGHLEILEGRIIDIILVNNKAIVEYNCKRTKTIKKLTVDIVVNCTGPQSNYRKMNHQLIENLIQNKYIQPDELHLGLLTDDAGALIDEKGSTSKKLFTIGPSRKGMLWETTALREIRSQAKLFVETINKLN